ncbi:MAG TPA: DUF6159 family protein [Candidatus Acidoferrales bacterium]|nr:DUF6159 family protein [Candidatus Acidoferrales bacterium]
MASWDLMFRSFRVLRRDKQLVLFPILSTLAAAAVSAPFAFALFGTGGVPHRWQPVDFALVFAWYVTANFAVVFFNCALAASAQRFFEGADPSMGEGMRVALERAPAILGWALISGTAGVFLRWLNERAGLVGRIAIGVLGFGWSLATYLIVPVLVIEERGVVDSIRRSGELLRKTWGDQICGAIAFGWMGLLFAIPGVVLGAIAVKGFWPLLPVAMLYIVAMAAVFSAARQVFTVALYRYATTGEPPEGYTGEGLSGAVRQR